MSHSCSIRPKFWKTASRSGHLTRWSWLCSTIILWIYLCWGLVRGWKRICIYIHLWRITLTRLCSKKLNIKALLVYHHNWLIQLNFNLQALALLGRGLAREYSCPTLRYINSRFDCFFIIIIIFWNRLIVKAALSLSGRGILLKLLLIRILRESCLEFWGHVWLRRAHILTRLLSWSSWAHFIYFHWFKWILLVFFHAYSSSWRYTGGSKSWWEIKVWILWAICLVEVYIRCSSRTESWRFSNRSFLAFLARRRTFFIQYHRFKTLNLLSAAI